MRSQFVTASVLAGEESNFALRRRGETFHLLYLVGEAVNILNEDLDDRRRPIMPAFQFLYTRGNVFVVCDDFTESGKGA